MLFFFLLENKAEKKVCKNRWTLFTFGTSKKCENSSEKSLWQWSSSTYFNVIRGMLRHDWSRFFRWKCCETRWIMKMFFSRHFFGSLKFSGARGENVLREWKCFKPKRKFMFFFSSSFLGKKTEIKDLILSSSPSETEKIANFIRSRRKKRW